MSTWWETGGWWHFYWQITAKACLAVNHHQNFQNPFMSSWLLTKACWQSLPKKLACCGSCPAHWRVPVFFLLEAVLWLLRRTRKMLIPQGKKKVNTGLYKFFSWPFKAETKLSLAEIPVSLVHLHTSLLSISSFLLSQFPFCCPTSHSPGVQSAGAARELLWHSFAVCSVALRKRRTPPKQWMPSSPLLWPGMGWWQPSSRGTLSRHSLFQRSPLHPVTDFCSISYRRKSGLTVLIYTTRKTHS